MKKSALFFAAFIMSVTAFANISVPKIFSSNMVLQRNKTIPVWGWADKNEWVTVTFHNQNVKIKTDNNGNWLINLKPEQAGGPYTMKISAKNVLLFENVLVGDVWLCGGQSNMEFPVSNTKNASMEIEKANYPNLRLFTVPKDISSTRKKDILGGVWQECNSETVQTFSAIGYFFGRDLNTELNVPIGLISDNWGGTVVETWMSSQTIEKDEDMAPKLKELKKANLEKLMKEADANHEKWLSNLKTNDLGMKSGKYIWAVTTYEDWAKMQLPSVWEAAGLPEIDGIVWFQKYFELSAEQAKLNLTIHLGSIDDTDNTFINGVEIGNTYELYSKLRTYTIDSSLLKPGKNNLVVRVEDYRGNGGLTGPKEEMYIDLGTSKIDLSGEWAFKVGLGTISPSTLTGPNSYPTLLYNAMIAPIIPYGLKGVIWYQGESNADRAYQYRRLFANLINDWRTQWKQGDFPFIWVQLANFMAPQMEPIDETWPELREAQTMTLALPNTGMAVTIDIGDETDIHPKNKQDVGKRLALSAFKVAYNKDIVYSGPTYKNMKIVGNKIYITFNNVGSGITNQGTSTILQGFTIASSDKKFHWAEAKIENDSTVSVFAPEVNNPVAVRYAWANNPQHVNLYNMEGLPAVPFRSDDWEGITINNK